MVNSQISKRKHFFRNVNLPKQLDNFFQKYVSVNPHNTRNEEQLHIPTKNTVKYGTKSVRYSAPLRWLTWFI